MVVYGLCSVVCCVVMLKCNIRVGWLVGWLDRSIYTHLFCSCCSLLLLFCRWGVVGVEERYTCWFLYGVVVCCFVLFCCVSNLYCNRLEVWWTIETLLRHHN